MELLNGNDPDAINLNQVNLENPDATEAIADFYDGSIILVFDRIRTRWPDRLSKLHPITGDVSVPNLGVNADQRLLLRKVTTLFHSAATVKFTEPLAAAATLNVQGTASLLQLAGDMPHLKVW
ncbi:hypothetical protein OBRU01_01104 [Operophtera brumata]|uniref:Fatty acyl-CoA reductase n=1 Tax=Operophtera brumata TaxID=104452 RepID=A0A0L7LSQ0_OPEBR|nr:hypothetical protein OBRU01_01104 [Operophtera brumata]